MSFRVYIRRVAVCVCWLALAWPACADPPVVAQSLWELPQILVEPADQAVNPGSGVRFDVGVDGTLPITYQWYKDEVPIESSNSGLLLISQVETADEGWYWVTATNLAGGVISRKARLTLNLAPRLTAQPEDLLVNSGITASFSVSATGTEPLTYQWFKENTTVFISLSNTFTIGPAQANDCGDYQVVVLNVAGSETSRVANLTLRVPPAITLQPVDQTVNMGSLVAFQAEATGTAPLSYQWLKNGAAILGANTNRLALNNAQADDSAEYTLAVTNLAGCATSTVARLTVSLPPVMQTQPASQTVILGETARFTAMVSGTEPLVLQWFKNGTAIANATSNLFRIESAGTNDAAQYWLAATNAAGGVTSAVALLTVLAPPSILTQPARQTVCLGQEAVFAVTAAGDGPLRYQWHKDNEAITGATNSVYALTVSNLNAGGGYYVVVENLAGSVQSDLAQLVIETTTAIYGRVTDALNHQTLAGVAIQIGGQTQTTQPDGSYAFTNLPSAALRADFTLNTTSGPAPLAVRFTNTSFAAFHTLKAEKADYLPYNYAPVEWAPGETKEWNFSLSPALNGLRIVLNWGRNPRDLDAHLLTPKMDGVAYHLQYSARFTGMTNEPPYAQLDTDATSGFGPETITISSNLPGCYRYYVNNYQLEQGNTGELAGSAAVAQIYTSAGLIQTITVPASGAGDYWDVCAIDGASGALQVINQLVARAPDAESGIADTGSRNLPSFLWDFGDGQTQSLENPSHLYAFAGTYSVSLRLTMPDGRTLAATQPALISVAAPIVAPQLTITREGPELVIEWESADAGFALESAASLATGTWTNAPEPPVSEGDGHYTSRITNLGQRYFRLRKY
jgi:PKD repeat protein